MELSSTQSVMMYGPENSMVSGDEPSCWLPTCSTKSWRRGYRPRTAMVRSKELSGRSRVISRVRSSRAFTPTSAQSVISREL